MGSYHGKDGAVDYAGTNLGEVRSWSYEESAELADATAMGATSKVYKTGIKDGSGSITMVHSVVNATAQDAGQAAVDIGESITLVLYPAGETSTYSKWSGTVVVTSIARSADLSKVGEFTINFQGGLTQGVVT